MNITYEEAMRRIDEYEQYDKGYRYLLYLFHKVCSGIGAIWGYIAV